MYKHTSITKSASTTEISEISQVIRPQTPNPEDRFSHSIKSLFTLADVAAKRRANGGFKKRTNKIDENVSVCGPTGGSTFLKRSRSCEDIAVLGENSRCLNVASRSDGGAAPAKLIKGLRTRSATTPLSKIPKAKSVAWLQSVGTSLQQGGSRPVSNKGTHGSDPDALSVDDAVFVLVTPARPHKKVLTLAAHTPSLPPVASPFSPRTSQPCTPQQPLARYSPPRSHSATGHTAASLHLTKSHWELRYENWSRSVCVSPPQTTENSQLTPTRSRFPAPLTNPALFPRAGSLTPKALRPVLNGKVTDEDVRPALEVDWEMRAWPLDRIQRTLFIHDMGVRSCVRFAGGQVDHVAKDTQHQEEVTDVELTRVTQRQAGNGGEGENKSSGRKWEWDWEIRWRLIEGMAEEESAKVDREYDVYLAEGDHAYGGCEMRGVFGIEKMDSDCESTEDAKEVDAIL